MQASGAIIQQEAAHVTHIGTLHGVGIRAHVCRSNNLALLTTGVAFARPVRTRFLGVCHGGKDDRVIGDFRASVQGFARAWHVPTERLTDGARILNGFVSLR